MVLLTNTANNYIVFFEFLTIYLAELISGGFFKLIFIGVESIYNVVLISAVEQSDSVIQIHISTFFRFFSHIGHYRVLSRVSCAIQ